LAYSERAYRSYLAQGDLTQAGAALTHALECAQKSGQAEEVTRLEKELRGLMSTRPSR
jgi:Tfp pilus assembly protein PilF